MRKTFKYFVLTSLFLPSVIGCNQSVPTFTSTIDMVHDSPLCNLCISDSVKSFKDAGFRYGDIIEFTFFDNDDVQHKHIAPFVTEFTSSGLFASAICDYEKAGRNLYICLGVGSDYDLIDNENYLVGQEINFRLVRREGYLHCINTINITAKRTLKFVGGDVDVYTNTRDIKIVGNQLTSPNFGYKVIYRMSSTIDEIENKKRFEISDHILRGIINNNTQNTYLIDLDHDIVDFTDLITRLRTVSINTCGLALSGHATSFDIGDTFFATNDVINLRKMFEKVIDYYEMSKEKYPTSTPTCIFMCEDGVCRTGIIICLLEALAEDNPTYNVYDNLISDYMLSYRNYYNILPTVSKEQERFKMIKNLTIDRFLYALTLESSTRLAVLRKIDFLSFNATEELENFFKEHPDVTINSLVRRYLKEDIGLTDADLTILKKLVKGSE